MKIREHKGSLADSMLTVKEIEPTIDALISLIMLSFKDWPSIDLTNLKDRIHIEYYGYDYRINWDTYIVTIKDYGVFGFTDSDIVGE